MKPFMAWCSAIRWRRASHKSVSQIRWLAHCLQSCLLKTHVKILLLAMPRSSEYWLPFWFSNQTSAHIIIPIHATHPAHLILLHWIFEKEYKFWRSSAYAFLHVPARASHLSCWSRQCSALSFLLLYLSQLFQTQLTRHTNNGGSVFLWDASQSSRTPVVRNPMIRQSWQFSVKICKCYWASFSKKELLQHQLNQTIPSGSCAARK
jgi:hypothetical protein